MQHITSVKNPVIQAARALKSKSVRDESGLFLCEGEHMVAEALASGLGSVAELFVSDAHTGEYAALLARAGQARVYAVSEAVLEALSQVTTPQGVAATVRIPQARALDALGPRVVLLENVQDPGNVGTVLRTADAAGFDACVLTPGCADPYAPKALRATMGSVFRVATAFAPGAADAAQALAGLGYAVLASVLDGEDFYRRSPLPPKVCLMVGNEGAGLTAEACDAATHHYRLPMRGGAESLNAAVAAAVFMYEIVNRG